MSIYIWPFCSLVQPNVDSFYCFSQTHSSKAVLSYFVLVKLSEQFQLGFVYRMVNTCPRINYEIKMECCVGSVEIEVK